MRRPRFAFSAVVTTALLLTIVCGAGHAHAATPNVQAAGPTSVTIDEIRPFEDADGYIHVEATMRGTVERDNDSAGAYAVPIMVVYPDNRGNGVGVVDWPNTSDLHNGGYTATADRVSLGHLALRTTDGYLFENGYTYAAVQWDKAVTEHFGPSASDGAEQHNHLIYGTIEEAEDAFSILRDIAHFLRDPSALEGAADLMPVDAVLSFGFSQSATLQMEFLSRGENHRNEELAYDGHLLGKAGLLCWTFHNEAPAYGDLEPCNAPPVEDGSKVIHVAAQGDVEALLYAGRSRFPDNPNWRQYELAGVSHIPVPIASGLDENQNPASSKPVFRAAFHNLVRWVRDGVPAPPSRFLEGTLNEDGTFDTALDEDGNALGGLRLPHLEQVIDGTVAGAPLGRYTGKHPNADPQLETVRWIGGYFEPFTDEVRDTRYPDREMYVERVTRAADYLLEAGYILEKDRDTYVDEARRATLSGAGSPSVEVEYRSTSTYGGLRYHFIEGLMRGSVEREDGSSGRYAVPIMLAYPESGGNGVGFVELPNTVGIGMTPNIRDMPRLGRTFETWPPPGLSITKGYLFREGYVYMAVQWDKAVTDVMGPEPPDGYTRRRLSYGSIERAADRYEIMRAAARWLREPSAFVTAGAPALSPQEHVIGYGFSQAGGLTYSFLEERLNEDPEGSVYYDGFLPHGVGNYRYPIIDEFPYWGDDIPSERALPGVAKVLALEMETDVQVFGTYHARDRNHGTDDEDPNHVLWELAGVSHLPQPYMAIDQRREYSPQNPIDFRSVTRAAIHHLTRWIVNGTEPPPTQHIEGHKDAEGSWRTERDEDGNALGGIRLPHMPRMLADGTSIGAPVGAYNGVIHELFPEPNVALSHWNTAVNPADIGLAISGTFERFSDERLTELYPNREIYEERYRAALDAVLEEGYIPQEDHDRYLARLKGIHVPGIPDLPEPRPEIDPVQLERMQLPEGGEVRLELLRPTRWAPEVRTHAWFASDQSPESRDWPRPPASWHIPDGSDLCRDLRDGESLPTGQVDRRTYVDVGDAVTLAANEADLVLGRRTEAQDDVTFHWHDIIYRDDLSPMDVPTGTSYTVHLPGSDAHPATSFAGALKLPADFELRFPDMDEPVVIPKGEDLQFVGGDPSDDPHALTVVTFALGSGRPVGVCIGPRSGYITVPWEFIEQMPSGGHVQYGHLHYGAEEHHGRRIDFVGLNARDTRYVVDRGRL